MSKEDFVITEMFQAAVDEAIEAGWTEERIRDELDVALGSAWEPE